MKLLKLNKSHPINITDFSVCWVLLDWILGMYTVFTSITKLQKIVTEKLRAPPKSNLNKHKFCETCSCRFCHYFINHLITFYWLSVLYEVSTNWFYREHTYVAINLSLFFMPTVLLSPYGCSRCPHQVPAHSEGRREVLF